MPDNSGASAVRASARFVSTHWSTVLAAGDSASPAARDALERLCRAYWYPLYAYVRRCGHSPEDARDLTQAFFERFLEKHYLKDVVREKGRFRSFLLLACKRFLGGQRDRAAASKRGGGVSFIPLDALEAENQFDAPTLSSLSPEAAFDRGWAEAVVRSSLRRLRAEYEATENGRRFQTFKRYLSQPADRLAYEAAGERLGISADAAAMAVTRLRRRYRELVRAEVANTVATPAEIDEEMRYLVELLAR